MNTIKKLIYITYQTFPANTANSIQTISNIKFLVREGVEVKLIFPLREKNSSAELNKLQRFYNFEEQFSTYGTKHNYPHGKIKCFKSIWFNLSHYMWSKKVVNKLINENRDETFFTRSDWVAYFLAKKGAKVTFEVHQNSKVRKYVLSKISNLDNLKLIFLNENLMKQFKNVKNKIVLQNGVDNSLFSDNPKSKKNSIIFMGKFERFHETRGITDIVKWFKDDYLKSNYILELIGASPEEEKKINSLILSLNLTNNVKVTGWVERKKAIQKLEESSIGILINSDSNSHSYLYTSPLKYFEYLYAELKIVAVDFPSHRSLPFNEFIQFFNINNLDSFIFAIKNTKKIKMPSQNQLYSITLENRAKKMIDFIY